MKKKPILVVPIVHAEQDLPGLLAKVSAGARVFIEQDKRLVAELLAVNAPGIAVNARQPGDTVPAAIAQGSLGLRDRARELFLDSVPSGSASKPVRRKYFGI